MPPKSVMCSVCGETILKSQTLARADGTRACRSHDGIKEEAEKLKVKRVKQEQARKEEKKNQFRFRSPVLPEPEEMRAWREHTHTHCWVCDREGIGLKEFFLQSLIAMKRL